jgi:hypothetical protein
MKKKKKKEEMMATYNFDNGSLGSLVFIVSNDWRFNFVQQRIFGTSQVEIDGDVLVFRL